MLLMHLPLPALVLPWLAGAGLLLLPGGVLAYLLAVRAIADLWTEDVVDDERRPVWVAALIVIAPVALIAYWWLVLRERLPDRVAAGR